MKTLYTLALLGILTVLSQTTTAQTTPQKEFGIRLSSINNFGVIYKKQKADDKYFRLRSGVTSIQLLNPDDEADFIFTAGLALGVEKRKPLGEKFYFLHGFEPRLNFRHIGDQTSITPGLGYILGFQADFSDRFYCSAEVIPSFSAVLNFDGPNIFGLDFNSNAAALSFVYRFGSGS